MAGTPAGAAGAVSVHPRARSFDGAAGAYERGRPGYPYAALEAVDEQLGLAASSAVLDLAAGTGKLTRQLVARYADVTAVEPLDEMRALLERAVPGARALAGTAEAIPLADGSVDAGGAPTPRHPPRRAALPHRCGHRSPTLTGQALAGKAVPYAGEATEVAIVRHDLGAVLDGECGEVRVSGEVSRGTRFAEQSAQEACVAGGRGDDDGSRSSEPPLDLVSRLLDGHRRG